MAGLGSILANPLVISVLAADALSQTANAYRAAQNAPNPDDDRFITRALASGGPVESIEPNRGFFGRALQGVGVLSDTTRATPDQIAKEKVALQRQQEGRQGSALEQALGQANIAKAVGSKNSSLFTKWMDAYSKGLNPPPIELAEPVPSEMRKRAGRMVAEYPTGSKYGSGGEKFVDVDANPSPEPGMTFQPPRPPKDELSPREKGMVAAEVTLGKAEALDKRMSLGEYETATKTSFWDPFTLTKIGSSKAKNAKEARDNEYLPVAQKDVPAMRQTRAALSEIDELIGVIGSKDSPFLDHANAAQLAINSADAQGLTMPAWTGGYKAWVGKSSTDPKVARLLREIFTVQIPTLYQLQKRYPSGIELKLTEDALPNLKTDTKVVAVDKLKSLRKSLRDSITAGVASSAENEEATSTGGLDSVFAPESPSGTETSDSYGPTILPPPPAELEEP